MKTATRRKSAIRSASKGTEPPNQTPDHRGPPLETGSKVAEGLTEEPFIESVGTGGQPGREQSVHLEFTDFSARQVCIAGSFNGWNPESTVMNRLGGGKWVHDLTLPPGTYEYRIVVDGKWMPDPNATSSVPNPFGEPNSVLIVSEKSDGADVPGNNRVELNG